MSYGIVTKETVFGDEVDGEEECLIDSTAEEPCSRKNKRAKHSAPTEEDVKYTQTKMSSVQFYLEKVITSIFRASIHQILLKPQWDLEHYQACTHSVSCAKQDPINESKSESHKQSCHDNCQFVLIRVPSPSTGTIQRINMPMLIQEVILENFMSYEYARVAFKQGLNVICGPNGSGKSSLLLAISVALGQSYTERSRKLSDLIRWGKDQGRITVVLNNAKEGNTRRVPKYNKDQIFLTRVLRRDGEYWSELENRAATKADVNRLLGKFDVDPDNILIIMHQNMVEQFTILSPQEKLRMVEAAVGLEAYRENVLQAQRKLTRTLSQEESVTKLLESAEQTLNYWREQYDRFQEKKQLQIKAKFLERELAWAEVIRREDIKKGLEASKRKEQETLDKIEEEDKQANNNLHTERNEFDKLKQEQKTLFDKRLTLERQKAAEESTASFCKKLLRETAVLETSKDKTIQLTLFTTENLKGTIQNFSQHLTKLNEEISTAQAKNLLLEEETDKVNGQILDTRVKLALLQYRRENTIENTESLEKELKSAENHLAEATAKAEQTGIRVAVLKTTSEILDETRVTEGHLAALFDVSEDIERMYESYSKLYLELKEKARIVGENREKALEEVKTRTHAWRKVMQRLLDRANLEYQKILIQSQAVGEVKLADEHDIEAAGLEILVGFKGGKPVPLDAYTQSGGERTTATMSFLLALQKHVRSPFRAVDEYDIHMDPKNREMIAKVLISTVKEATVQYVVITPSQITFADDEVNIVTVQNIEGKSIIREVA